jgi:hypothetical protein
MLTFRRSLTGLLLCTALSPAPCLFGQSPNLPASMYLVENEHVLYTGGLPSSGLYDEGQIRVLELWFAQQDYWQQLADNYNSQTDIPATLIAEGDTFQNVGVRFKGQTSYTQSGNTQKKSFNITLDYAVPGQNLMGYGTLNLNNCFQDPSFLREIAYLHQIRRHVPAAKAAFVHLFINGESWGLYPNVQQLNGDFLEEWFFGNDGTRWRADRPDGTVGPGPGGGPNWGDGTAALNYLGADTTLYQPYYTLKKAHKPQPWADLVQVCNLLNNTALDQLEATLKPYLDIDRTLWFLASEIAFSDDDSYVYKGKMDYYLYWDPETGRITPLEVDGNSVMKSNAANWSPFYNANKVNYPLLNRLLMVPALRQRYLAHMRTLIAEEMNSSTFNALIDQYDALINSAVQADPKKIYTYNQYLSERTVLKNFVSNHRNTLLAHPEMAAQGPILSNAAMLSAAGAWASPLADEAVWATVQASATNGVQALQLHYCGAPYGNFSSTPMFDDGAHNDGASGDGLYGAQLPGFPTGTLVRFYVEGIANNGVGTRSYLPAGAEHDVFYYRIGAAWASERPVVINELMASNDNTAADEAGEYEDWIELHNTSDAAVDISGFFLTDNPSNLQKWAFPDNTVLPAKGYLIVWADEDGSQGPFHANFKLSASGESLALLDASERYVDTVQFQQQTTDLGLARVPNGTGPFVQQSPTFNADNDTVSATAEGSDSAAPQLQAWPNPAKGQVLLRFAQAVPTDAPLRVFDPAGRLVWTEATPGRHQILSVQGWPAGLYLVECAGQTAKLVVE